MSHNSAAWLPAAKATPFDIQEAPMWKPEEGEILIRNKAVAINPVDVSIQAFAWYPLEYPTILGHDVSGDVVEVGSNVTRFKKGDRVVGQAVGMATKRNQENAFQLYATLKVHMASPLPANISYEDGVVIPLGLSTAACGLYQEGYLQLDLPTEPKRPSNGKTLLVWGGSSSVGSNAIQLAVASGYEVIATASPKNFELCKKLGAYEVFDYKSLSIRNQLLEAFQDKTCAGVLDAIGGEGCIIGVELVHKTTGSGVVASTKGGAENVPESVKVARIFGTTLKDNFVGPAIYQDFLPAALKAGSLVPAPKAQIFGHGLEAIQGAVDALSKGVSATKLVVTL